MRIIAIVILLIGIYIAIKNPFYFTFYFGILGCRYDSCGITYFFSQYFGLYTTLFEYLLVLAVIMALFRLYKNKDKINNLSIQFISVFALFIFTIILSTLVTSLKQGNFNIDVIIYSLVNYGPLIMIIWVCYNDRYNFYNTLKLYLIIQILIAFFIVYLPVYGVDVLNSLSGSNYVSDGFVYNNNIAKLSNFMEIFGNKYIFNGLGQFHNGNDMGFYGCVGCVVFGFQIYKKKNILMYSVMFMMSCFLWFNSGMRGPVIGTAMALLVYLIISRLTYHKFIYILLATAMLILMLFIFPDQIMSYFIPSTNNVSFISRNYLRLNTISYIASHPYFGAGGLLSNLTVLGIDAHELPLRITSLFGVMSGIVATIGIYVLPVYHILHNKSYNLIAVIFIFICFLVSLTNNYTCIMLFWMLMSTSIFWNENRCVGINNTKKIKFKL